MNSTVIFLLEWAVFSLIGHSLLAFFVHRFAIKKEATGELQKFSVQTWTILTFFAGIFGLGFFVLIHGEKKQS